MSDYLIYFSYVFKWWLMGLPLSVIMFAIKKEEVLIGDIPAIFILALVGPLWFVVYLLDVLNIFYNKYKHTPIWQSKKRKAESILYNKKRDD